MTNYNKYGYVKYSKIGATPRPPGVGPTNAEPEYVKPSTLPHLECNPHFYLEYAEKWFDQLHESELDEVEIETDFNIPYGVMVLVMGETRKEFELIDGDLNQVVEKQF